MYWYFIVFFVFFLGGWGRRDRGEEEGRGRGGEGRRRGGEEGRRGGGEEGMRGWGRGDRGRYKIAFPCACGEGEFFG